jgi:cell division septation protein DedD
METNLKARTLGAIVTVLGLALILPNILHRDKGEAFTTEIPPKPDTPTWVDEKQHTRVRIELNQLAEGQSEKVITAAEPRTVINDDPRVSSISDDKAGLDMQGAAVAWTLQVGAFGDEKNAIKHRDNLRNKGFKAYILKNENTKLDHVYVGPMLQRSKAEAERTRLIKNMAVKGIRLQQYKPE